MTEHYEITPTDPVPPGPENTVRLDSCFTVFGHDRTDAIMRYFESRYPTLTLSRWRIDTIERVKSDIVEVRYGCDIQPDDVFRYGEIEVTGLKLAAWIKDTYESIYHLTWYSDSHLRLQHIFVLNGSDSMTCTSVYTETVVRNAHGEKIVSMPTTSLNILLGLIAASPLTEGT